MTRRIPLRYCRSCPHFNGLVCRLNDLQPCKRAKQVEDDMKMQAFLAAIIALIIAMWILFLYGCSPATSEEAQKPQSVMELLRAQHATGMTEQDTIQKWQPGKAVESERTDTIILQD